MQVLENRTCLPSRLHCTQEWEDSRGLGTAQIQGHLTWGALPAVGRDKQTSLEVPARSTTTHVHCPHLRWRW